MKLCTPLLLGFLGMFSPLLLHAENEIGFIEKFALAPDREQALAQLIPGSEDYYYFYALHYENTGQKDKLKTIMTQWSARFPDSERRKIIENREALLDYGNNPQGTLDFLRRRLNLQFNHQQEARDQKPDLPTTLDQAKISREVFQKEAFGASSDDLSQFREEALEALVREKTPLNPAQRRALLAALSRPDIPGLLDVIEADLRSKESKGFGEFPIHRALLPEQLDELATHLPTLYNSQAFIFTRLRKLLPGADVDLEFDRNERQAWLERLWTYAKNLDPAFNTLKAYVLHARLELDRTRGVYDKALFLEYLKLPRRLGYMNAEYLRRGEMNSHLIDLNADMSEVLISAIPIGNDEPLVREYFLEIFKDEPSWEPWAGYVRDSLLKQLFAESKILHGVGDPTQWAALLSPTAFQALKDRVDLNFSPTNPPFINPGSDVVVQLAVKNVQKLIVRTYEVNTLSFFLTQKRQLNTDVNLDGLVANAERTVSLADDPAGRSPFRRVAHTFSFPELKGKRGAWVVEFIGGGRSSRSLIRTGEFHLLQDVGPAGEMLTILDEAHKPVPSAVVWMEGRKYTPDEKTGKIIIPFTQQPGEKPIILADAAGTFATLTRFQHHGEEYRLDAQFHIEREQLLAGRQATLAIRTSLFVAGEPVALNLIQEPRLTLQSTTLDGITTTREVTEKEGLKLDPAKDYTLSFPVPDRVASLTATLTCKVEQLSTGGEKKDLSASRSWQINGIDKTEATNDGHLTKFGDNYVFELLGKGGEPITDQQVVFEFLHRLFHRRVTVPLRTDERGRITLGALKDIAFVESQIPNGRKGSWDLASQDRTWTPVRHAKAGDVVHIPWADGPITPENVSLLEIRGGTFARNYFNALSVASGLLEIKALPAGDYSLRISDGTTDRPVIAIRVTAGDVANNWVISENRPLEIGEPEPLQVESVTPDEGGISIRLRNTGPLTRVHVAATRFLPKENLFKSFGGFMRPPLGEGRPGKFPNVFTGGRDIGDEYRYILERRYSKLFPGNMLFRPGLLLNPWEVRSTDLEAQSISAMEAPAAGAGGRPGSAAAPVMQAAKEIRNPEAATPGTNLDFLAAAAPVMYNLIPDQNGVVWIDRNWLGDRQYIQVLAADLNDAVWNSLALPEVATKSRDLRLTRPLDPTKAFTETRKVTALHPGQTLTVSDVLGADLETYDSLASIYSLFATLNKDANLAKFAFVLQWPKLSEEEKRAKYSEFACHELHFFLAKKDPQFFEKVVLPYLRNKKDKTFMDDFLLGNDLRPYLDLWAYARLNMAERALLAQRIPEEAASTKRHLRELWELIPPNPERLDVFFDIALRGHGLTEAEKGMFGDVKQAARLPYFRGRGIEESDHLFAGREALGIKDIKREMNEPLNEWAAQTGLMPAAPALAAPAQAGAAVPGKKSLEAGQRADASRSRGYAGFEGAVALGREDLNRLREQVRPFYRRIGPTREWAENNYYRLRIVQQNADLIPINTFWRDYAAWDGKAPFLSEHITEASRNFAEMMLALAVLDLPFESPKHQTRTENNQFTLTAAGPLLAFHREVQVAQPAEGQTDLLLSENFFRQDDRFRMEGNEKSDKYVKDEFLAGVVYGGNVVVTNPTSSPQKVELLLQIPQGALPVLGSKTTDSRRLQLEPYSTKTFEYYFYFPIPGEAPFTHYPAHVSKNDKAAGGAKATTFKVVRQLTQIDKASWDYISQYGSDEDVFKFIDENNIARLNLVRVAWRVRKSAEFFRRMLEVLQSRHDYDDTIYSYAVVHNDKGALSEWLKHRDEFLAMCGPYLDSPLLRIDPIERRAYEHLEYSPLINQRMHRVGSENRIPNPVLRAQYQALMNIVAHKPALDPIDQMSVVYYLFLQDRVEEALARFHGIKPETLPTRLQHDYFRCYAAFYEEQLGDARNVASQYVAYPVDRWRRVFTEVIAQLDEIEGKEVAPRNGQVDGKPDREAQQGTLASTEPTFDFKVDNKQIELSWRNLPEVTINYYLMDPEFLFSSSPFVTEDPGRFSIIKPTRSDRQALKPGEGTMNIQLPGEFAKANVLVEILGGGQRKAQAFHANTIKLALAQNYGRIEIRDSGTGKPVSKAYVKVYARLKDGQIRFYKDGYTDLRGKFDYASLNSGTEPGVPTPMPADGATTSGSGNLSYQMLKPTELGAVEKLAILVLSDTNGALVREVNPPAE